MKKDENIVSVILPHTKLKKLSMNRLVGFCPFCKAHSPTFFVSWKKQSFHCFHCGKGGDAEKFASLIAANSVKRENVDHAASNLLADAASFFASNAGGLEYFRSRGLSEDTMRKFNLGYAPKGSKLLSFLKQRGYSEENLLSIGLIKKNEKEECYDSFRNRVIFPIFNESDEVIGFGGRVLDDSKPKYLNSSESDVFAKKKNLFALNFAKKSNKDFFILTEGYMDVIALHQAGFDNAVASLGTALTEEQANLLARYVTTVVVAYDSDDAGRRATLRAVDILDKAGLKVKILTLPEGSKDPDELMQTTAGIQLFQRCIDTAEDSFLYLLQQIRKKYDESDEKEMKTFLRECAMLIDGAEDRPVSQNIYAKVAVKFWEGLV